jgi:type I restriction enzyme M protein
MRAGSVPESSKPGTWEVTWKATKKYLSMKVLRVLQGGGFSRRMSRRAALKQSYKLDLRAYAGALGIVLPPDRDLIDGEELIFERALRPIFFKLGYESDDLFPKPSYTPEIVGERREVDWGIYRYDVVSREGGFIPLFGMVVDVKGHGIDLTNRLEEKLAGYCALFDSKCGILANDRDLIALTPTRGAADWEYLSRIPSKAELMGDLTVRPTYTLSDKIFARRIASVEDMDESVIEKIADDCNDIIRRRKGMWGKKRQYEFSKLLLLRIQDEREYVEGLKDELEITFEGIRNLRERGIDITAHLNTLFRGLVSKIGIFPPDEKIELNDGVIEETVQRLDVHPLWLKKLEILGQVFERFLMNTMTGRELGEFFTPRSLVNLTVGMVNPTYGERILDPACGTGGFLIYSLYHVLSKDSETSRACEFYGIEIDEDTHKLAKINSYLHNDSHKNIIRADSLDPTQAPLFLTDALRDPTRQGFDCILTNPPFGATGRNRIPSDTMKTFSEGWGEMGIDNFFECAASGRDVIPQSAFLELCIKSLKKPDEPLRGGRLGTIIDFGILSNVRNEEPLTRRVIRRETILEAVIGLPKGSFKMYGSNVIPCILVLRRRHESEKQGSVFRTDIRKIGYVPGATRFRPDSDEHIKAVLVSWNKWTHIRGTRT